MEHRLVFGAGLSAAAAALLFAGPTACGRQPRQLAPNNQAVEAQVSLFNATHDVLPLRFQSLRRQFGIDCELASQDPGRYLRDEHLSHPLQHLVLSGEEVSFFDSGDQADPRPSSSSECVFSFLTVSDERLPSIAVSWSRSLPKKVFYTDVDAPPGLPPEAPALIAEADYSATRSSQISPWRNRPCEGSLTNCDEVDYEAALTPPQGASYHWSVIGDELNYSPSDSEDRDELVVHDPEDDEHCRTGRGHQRLLWSRMAAGRWKVLEVKELPIPIGEPREAHEDHEGSSRCYELYLERADGSELHVWTFCGSERLARRLDPEGLRGRLMVEFFTEDLYGSPPAAYENLTIDIRRETEAGELFETETIELIRGQGVPDHLGIEWETSPVLRCEPRREIADCGQVVLPLELRVDTPNASLAARPQETIALDINAERRLEYIRGMHRVVVDNNCADDRLGPHQFSYPDAYLELIYYAGVFTFGE